MDSKNIVQQGEKLKYIVTSRNQNFNMEECDFYVEILYGMMGKKLVIPKSDFLYSTGGEYVLMFSTDGMVGKLTARMVWQCHDTDSDPNNQRQEVDEQIIAFVVTTPCPHLLICPACPTDRDVNYERTDDPDIASLYVRLCVTETITPDGGGEPYNIYRPLITRDDSYLYVLRGHEGEVLQALGIN